MEIQGVEVLAEGLAFPEGPVALPDGSVLVVEILRGRLSRVGPGGRVVVVADLGGGPNGAAIGPYGAAYVCNNGGMTRDSRIPPCVQRVDLATGRSEVLYTGCDGASLLAPNDLVFDTAGGMWFTDSGYAGSGERKFGAICYAAPDGSSIRRVVSPVDQPNGIGLSPGGDILYWAQTGLRQVLRRRITAPGVLAPSPGLDLRALVRRGSYDRDVLLAGLPGYQELDSLAVEAGGSVCVGTLVDGCLTVISPDGASVERMTLPPPRSDPLVTNICCAGPDLMTALVTLSATGVLLSCRWPRPGLRLAFQDRP